MEDKSMMVNALVGNEPKAAARGNRTRNTTARGRWKSIYISR